MESVSVAIVGSGFSGLAAAAALERSGEHDLVVLERGASLGGVWRDNVYPGFPNLFLMTGPNTGLGHSSMVEVIEAQARYVAEAVALLRVRGGTLDVRPEVEDAYARWLEGRGAATVWMSGCRSWYLDARGRNVALWPGTAHAFQSRLARLEPADFALTPRAATGTTAG